MFIDFLISLWATVVDFLGGILPAGDTSSGGVPSGVTSFLANVFYYVDPTPFGILIALIASLLIGFFVYKVINIVFNWISGLF